MILFQNQNKKIFILNFEIYSENVQKIMNGNCNGNGHLSSEEEGDQQRENHIEL